MVKLFGKIFCEVGLKIVLLVAALGYIVLLTFNTAHFLQLDRGFPKGFDSMGHLSEVKFIEHNFPHILWNSDWYMGVVGFPTGYPPLYHFGLGLAAKYLVLDPIDLMRNTLLVSILVIAVCLGLIGYILSGRLLLVLCGPLLLISSPAFWSFPVEFGLHIRVFGFALYSLFLVAFLAYFRWRLRFKERFSTVLYVLVVISLTAVLLAHLFVGAIAVLTLAILTWGFEKEKRPLKFLLKTLVIAFGLAAFYYVPYFGLSPVKISMIGRFTDPVYAPIKISSLFRLENFGLGVILLPLTGVLIMAVKFVRVAEVPGDDAVRLPAAMNKGFRVGFYFFAALGIGFILYGLGLFKFSVLSIYTSHTLFFTAFWLTLAAIFGVGFLGRRIITAYYLMAIILVLTVQTSSSFGGVNLRPYVNNYPSASKFGISNIDETRNYRFANYAEKVAAVFNLVYDGLQTRGYFSQSIVFPGFNHWFEEAVFNKNGNWETTKFLFDWFAINNVLTAGNEGWLVNLPRDKSGGVVGNFSGPNNRDFLYGGKTPIFTATDAPAVYVSVGDSLYQKIVMEIAAKGLSLDRVIPLHGSLDKGLGENAIMASDIEEMAGSEPVRNSGDKLSAIYKNTGHWEVLLSEPYKGLVFKQNYTRNWQARLVDGGGKAKRLTIYMAGPGMMYVSLPQFEGGARVIFEYKLSLVQILGFLVSAVTLVTLLAGFLRPFFSYGRKSPVKGPSSIIKRNPLQ